MDSAQGPDLPVLGDGPAFDEKRKWLSAIADDNGAITILKPQKSC